MVLYNVSSNTEKAETVDKQVFFIDEKNPHDIFSLENGETLSSPKAIQLKHRCQNYQQ